MKAAINSKSVQQDSEILYVGTNEQIAKLAPIKGLKAPVILTDVYSGFFCRKNNDLKWGIISIIVDKLCDGMFAPFHFKSDKKINWQKSLKDHGACLYNRDIPQSAILKVTIYNPVGNEANIIINKLIEEQNPQENHKLNYKRNLGITKWLNGEDVDYEEIYNGETSYKLINEMGEKLRNKSGLDVFYFKPEEKVRKSKNVDKEE